MIFQSTTQAVTQLSEEAETACDAILSAQPGHDVRIKDFKIPGMDIHFGHHDSGVVGLIIYSRQDMLTPFSNKPLPVLSLAATYTNSAFFGSGVMRRLFSQVLELELGLIWPLRRFVCVSAILSPRLYAFYSRRFLVHPRPHQTVSRDLHKFAETALGLPKGWLVDEQLIIRNAGEQHHDLHKVTVDSSQWSRTYASGQTAVDTFFKDAVFAQDQDNLWLTTRRLWVVAEHKPLRDWFGRPRRVLHGVSSQ